MISPRQLSSFRQMAHRVTMETYPTTITIGEHTGIPAARWKAAKTTQPQGIGTLLPTVDITVRIDLAELTTRSITVKPERTLFVEGGVTYRVAEVQNAEGDPGIIIKGKTA